MGSAELLERDGHGRRGCCRGCPGRRGEEAETSVITIRQLATLIPLFFFRLSVSRCDHVGPSRRKSLGRAFLGSSCLGSSGLGSTELGSSGDRRYNIFSLLKSTSKQLSKQQQIS